MAYLHGRTIGLDAPDDRQAEFLQLGFTPAYRIIRHVATGCRSLPEDTGMLPLAACSRTALAAYDRRFFPASRDAFLACWVEQPGATALGVVQDGNLAGYGVVRVCRRGYAIGPLCADSGALAERLLSGLFASVDADQPVSLDVPEVNPAALALAELYEMRLGIETVRMFTGPPPAVLCDGLFGVTALEIG